jgi:hypothetical protein
VLDPVELSVALGHPQFVQMLAALDQTRERERVVELVGDDEVCAVSRELVDRGEKCRAGFSPPLRLRRAEARPT